MSITLSENFRIAHLHAIVQEEKRTGNVYRPVIDLSILPVENRQKVREEIRKLSENSDQERIYFLWEKVDLAEVVKKAKHGAFLNAYEVTALQNKAERETVEEKYNDTTALRYGDHIAIFHPGGAAIAFKPRNPNWRVELEFVSHLLEAAEKEIESGHLDTAFEILESAKILATRN